METDVFNIKTGVFEGPLDLLLQLIEKHKLLINDISLASVTDDYIAYVKSIQDYPMSKTSHFILIASTLLLLKSKSLLPTLTLTNEEEESIEDLEMRLKLYKYFQGLSKDIREQFGVNIIYPRNLIKIIDPVFSPQKNFTAELAHDSILNVIRKLPKKKIIKEVTVQRVISLEKSIENLSERVRDGLNVSFREFSKLGKAEKINVIVNFLAMLELVKQEIISVKQEAHFDDIHMESQDIGIPKY